MANISRAKKRYWTADEDLTLKEWWPKGGGYACSKLLDRSIDSMRTRACLLGLKAPRSASQALSPEL